MIYKLFRYDRPIIITSAVLNIVISIALVNKLGINGVLIGTFITSLVYLFSRFYIIARHVYDVKYIYYIKKILYYGAISTFTFFISYMATKNVNGEGLHWFVIRVILVVIIALFSTAFLLSFGREFDFLKNKLLPEKIRKRITKCSIGIICIGAVVIAFIFGGGA